jgi:hypothetical protein
LAQLASATTTSAEQNAFDKLIFMTGNLSKNKKAPIA